MSEREALDRLFSLCETQTVILECMGSPISLLELIEDRVGKLEDIRQVLGRV